MSIATRIEAIEQHLTDDYSILELAGADLTNVDKNILNLKTTWQERLLYFMNNGTDIVWNNWDKVTGEGTTLTLNNTLEGKMKIDLKGNTSQEGTPTPETPQDIHVVSGDNSIDVCGKNLANINNISNSSVITIENDTIKLSNNSSTSGYVSLGIKLQDLCPTLKEGDVVYLFFDNTSSSTLKDRINVNGDWFTNASKTITQAMLNAYVIMFGGYNETAIISNFMITKVNDSSYQPYKSVSYPITLPEGMFLGWIPNTTYRDRIFQAKTGDAYYDSLDSTTKESLTYGKWYLKKEISKKSNLSSYYRDLTTNYNNLQYIRINKMTDSANYGNSNNIPVVFTHGIYQVITAFDQAVNIGRITSSGGYPYFYFGVDKTTTIEQAQTLLSNATIYYPLATPTYTEITDSTLLNQLEAVKRSYDGQTNISQSNNDLPFIINATALKEMT